MSENRSVTLAWRMRCGWRCGSSTADVDRLWGAIVESDKRFLEASGGLLPDLAASGNRAKHEHRHLAGLCGKLIHEMELLRQAESMGRWRSPQPVLGGPNAQLLAELA
jgi:hypothetical protein